MDSEQAVLAVVEGSESMEHPPMTPDAVIARPDAAAVSVFTNNGAPLAKRFWMKDGELKSAPAAQLTDGLVTVQHVTSVTELAQLLDGLNSSQAVAYGVPAIQRARVVTKATHAQLDAPERTGVVTRTREHFFWLYTPGVWMLDIDPDHMEPSVLDRVSSPERLRAVLCTAMPALANAPMLWRPSASSGFLSPDGVALVRGQRVYVLVDRAGDIPSLGETLADRLWLMGLGTFAVSKGGQLLARTIVDCAVWQPERLDFAAPPILGDGLRRQPPHSRTWLENAPPLATREVPPLTASERQHVEALKRTARETVRPLQRQRFAEYVAAQVPRLAANGVDESDAIVMLKTAVEQHVLGRQFEVQSESGETVTVGRLLDEPDRWHDKRFHDPLEPDYRNDSRIAWVNLRPTHGPAFLYSHAHGGCRYLLLDRPVVRLEAGERTRVTDETIDALLGTGELYRLKDALVVPTNEGLSPVNSPLLSDLAERAARFEKWNEKMGWVPTDLAGRYTGTILARLRAHDRFRIPDIVAISRAPFLREDGSLADQVGYDAASRVLLIPHDGAERAVRRHLSIKDAREALRQLWEPFQYFPLESSDDRGALLALILLASTRCGLPIAPGAIIDATEAGSGKTLLARAVAHLTGSPAAQQPFSDQEEELRKMLFSAARSGTPAVVFDNLPRGGLISSTTLNLVITAETVADRVLGESTREEVAWRPLIILTGNNLQVANDANGRLLRIRLTPQVEEPWKRNFTFDPVQRVAGDWRRLRNLALELMITAMAEGVEVKEASGFPTFDRVIRRTVQWIEDCVSRDISFGDPVHSFQRGYAEDPERSLLTRLLTAWHAVYHSRDIATSAVLSNVFTQPELDAEDPRNELRAAVEEIAPRHTPKEVGDYLRKNKERIAAGLKLVATGESRGKKRWAVLKTDFAKSDIS